MYSDASASLTPTPTQAPDLSHKRRSQSKVLLTETAKGDKVCAKHLVRCLDLLQRLKSAPTPTNLQRKYQDTQAVLF